MVTWRDSFERISSELDVSTRKKLALENLNNAGRISQFAYECLNKELTDEIEQIEIKRKALAEKMTSKLNELEEQRMALELFLANTEMAYVAGEINDEIHAKESAALDLGLEATKQELDWIKEAIIQLVPKEAEPTQIQDPAPAEPAEPSVADTTGEKTNEPAETAHVEAPVEVTATVTEVKVEQIQTATETSTDTQATTSDTNPASEEPFRQPGGEAPK
jgi:hypothetical protein